MIISREDNESVIWGIWKTDESIEQLLADLSKTNHNLNTFSPKRLKEQASVRILLKTLVDEEKIIDYLPNGKPYLVDSSYNISISHTRGYVAIVLSKSEYIGIDIEHVSEKVKRVKDRFISEKEYVDPNNETIHLLLHWSAKETMYKAISREGVELKNDFIITKFTPSKFGIFDAKEFFTEHALDFKIKYWVENDYVLTLTY